MFLILLCRNNFRVSASSEESEDQNNQKSHESNIPQKVLESLFSIPESPVRKPGTMNWRNVVKKLESFRNGFNIQPPSTSESQKDIYGTGTPYLSCMFKKLEDMHDCTCTETDTLSD